MQNHYINPKLKHFKSSNSESKITTFRHFHYISHKESIKTLSKITKLTQNYYISNLQFQNPKSLHLVIFTTFAIQEIWRLCKITIYLQNHYIAILQTQNRKITTFRHFHYIYHTGNLKTLCKITIYLQNHYIANLQTHNPKSLHFAIFTTSLIKKALRLLAKSLH